MELETDPEFWLERRLNTVTGIIHRIFEEEIRLHNFSGHSHLDIFLQSVLIKKALKNRGMSQEGLLHFNRIADKTGSASDFPGICRNISRFFSLLYRNNYEDIFADDLGRKYLREEEKSSGSPDEKYGLESDLLWLMGEYEELKKEAGLYDDNDIYSGVRDFLKENRSPRILKDISVIILDGITHLSRIEEDILFSIISNIDELWWLTDFETDEEDFLSAFGNACGYEAAFNTRKAKEGENEEFRALYSLTSLMERLSVECSSQQVINAEAFHNPGDLRSAGTGALRIGAFSSEVEEIRGIASEIKKIIHENNLDVSKDLGKIRLLFPDLNACSSVITEVFSEYGLPFSLTKGISLASHPLALFFSGIFQAVINGYKRKDVFRLLASPLLNPKYFRFDLPEFTGSILTEKDLLAGDNIEAIINICRETAGSDKSGFDIFVFDRGAIRCGIEELGDELQVAGDESLSECRDIYSQYIDNTGNIDEKLHLRMEYYSFIYQCRILRLILCPFNDLKKCSSPDQITNAFEKILGDLGFPLNILDINRFSLDITGNEKRNILKRDIRAFTLLNELLESAEREVNIVKRFFNIRKDDEILSLFYSSFKNRLDNRYLHDERNPNVIRISQWLEIRGRSFDYVFAGGLTSGRFPLREESEFIIPESSKRMFRIIDPVDQSKYLFGHLLKNCRKTLFLSCPRYISEKPVQPSQVIQDITACCRDDIDWKPGPYFSSNRELIHSGIIKCENKGEEKAEPFRLKNIVLKKDSGLEDITRGVRTLVSRWAVNGLFEYDGMTDTASCYKDFLKNRSMVFSPSSLDILANCPMKYLFSHIYKLKSLDEIIPDITPGDIGKSVHDILSIFFRKLRALKTNVSGAGIETAFKLAGQAVKEYSGLNPVFDRLDLSDFYYREMFSGLDRGDLPKPENENIRWGILPSLIFFEETGFRDRLPEGMEYEFGTGKSPVKLGDISVHGYIDRFDIRPDNPDDINIYDYKTGFIKASGNVKKGLSFQLPVYIKALEQLMNPSRISAAFYSLKRDAFLNESPLKNTVTYNYDSRDIDISGVTLIDAFIEKLQDLIIKGIFHFSPDGLECRYCSYKYACHRDERRMSHLAGLSYSIYSGEKNISEWNEADGFKKEWKKIKQSMEKALSLKTAPARKRHFDTVMEFRRRLDNAPEEIPLTDKYVEGIIEEMERFRLAFPDR